MELSEQEIEEGNKLIDDWMGRNYLIMLSFHSSWDWLMEAVECIESIRENTVDWDYCVTIERDYCCISHKGESPIVEQSTESGSKIEATFRAVVAFIKWYNKPED